jgi:hypothetical protein
MIIAEDAEGEGTPSGWADEGTGTKDWDYTTTALRGNQSLYLSGTSAARTTYTFSGEAEIWGHFLYRIGTVADWDIIFYGGDGTEHYVRFAGTDGTIRQVGGGDGLSSSANTIVADTTYHIWYHITAGSGTGSCYLYVGTSTTRPASPTISQTGKTISNITAIQARSENTNVHIFDQIRVSDAEFTTVCD